MDLVSLFGFLFLCILVLYYYHFLTRRVDYASYKHVAEKFNLQRNESEEAESSKVNEKLQSLSYLKNTYNRGKISNYSSGIVEKHKVQLYHLRVFAKLRTESAYNMADIDVVEIDCSTSAFKIESNNTNDIKLSFDTPRRMVRWKIGKKESQDLFTVSDALKAELLTACNFVDDPYALKMRFSMNFLRYNQGKLFVMSVHSSLAKRTISEEELSAFIDVGVLIARELKQR